MDLQQVLPKYTIILDTQEDHERKQRISEIKKQLSAFNEKRRNMFGFEGKEGIDSAIKNLEKQQKSLEVALAGFPTELSLEVLSLVNPITNFPYFMVLGIHDNKFSLSVNEDGEFTNVSPRIPNAMLEQYAKTAKRLQKIAKSMFYSRYSATISARFEGEMSDEDRKTVKDASNLRIFDEIYMIAEAPSWKLDVIRVADDDPVVIGWVRSTEQAFIIRVFNPTENESYAVKNFTKNS